MEFKEPRFLDVLLDILVRNTIARPLYKRYVKSLGLADDEKVIDFGSGSGVASRYIAQSLLKGNGQLTCVDLSKVWMRVAEKRLRRYPNVDFKLGDVRNLDIEPDSYDAILIHFVLHDVEQRARQTTVRALAGALKAGGKILIREPTEEDHGVSVSEIRELMTEAGLEEVQFKTTDSMITGSMYTGRFEKAAQL